jgi:hypothetical protein
VKIVHAGMILRQKKDATSKKRGKTLFVHFLSKASAVIEKDVGFHTI